MEENNNIGRENEDVQVVEAAAEPRKKGGPGRKFWFILLAAVAVVAVLSPFVYGVAKKMYLRSNPDLYVVSVLQETNYNTGSSAEITAGIDFSQGAAESIVALAEALSNVRLNASVSAMNKNAKEGEVIAIGKYLLSYGGETVFDAKLAFGPDSMRADVFGTNIFISGETFLPNNFVEIQSAFDEAALKELIKDKEVSEIIRELFENASLVEKDYTEARIGKACDVVNVKFSARDIYNTIKKFVGILDSNAALKKFADNLLLTYIDKIENNIIPGNKENLAEAREFVTSGKYIGELQNAFKSFDQQSSIVLSVVNVMFDIDYYISEGVFVGASAKLSFEVPEFFVNDKLTVWLKAEGFVTDEKTTGSIQQDADSIILDIKADMDVQMAVSETVRELAENYLKNNAAFKRMLEDFSKAFPGGLMDF